MQHLSVRSVMYGIFLQGMPHYDPIRGLSLSGNVDKLPRNVTQTYIKSFYRHRWDGILKVDNEAITTAARVAKGILSIYSGNQFSRLKRGFDAWIRGVSQDRPDYRLHEFVRALEALLMPTKGSQFVHRCKTLARVPKADNVFREIYGLRNQVEHHNEWDAAFDDDLKATFAKAELGDRAMVRSFQIELLASATYIEILSSAEKLGNFVDDSAISTFWKAPRWTERIGLEKLLNKRWDSHLEKPEVDRLRRVSC